jgi:ABC-2 type transport system ATP-binding protein
MASAIQVQNIKRSFKSTKKEEGLKGSWNLLVKPTVTEHEALKGVSFEIEEGAFVGLIGANGAGKTTLLKILSGLIPPSSGEARVLGFEPFERAIDFRKTIALVMGQKAQLWWDLPALDAFGLLQAIYQIPEKTYRERLETLTELLDVKKHLQTQIRRLSLGERMKMELIGALIHWPKVIFLDEPTIGLDVLAAQKLREFLKEFNRREKATIILTSHNMDDIQKLCSRILIIREGSLIFDGAPGELTQSGERRLRVRLKEQSTLAELASITGVDPQKIELPAESSEAGGDDEDSDDVGVPPIYFSLSTEQMVPVLQKLMTSMSVLDMGIEEQSLESVIQQLFAGKTHV